MIYDSHAYCIPDQKGDGGFETRGEFQRLLQYCMAHHFAPALRAKDRALGDSSALVDLSKPFSLNAVKEANFHAAGHGRFEWEMDGDVYFKQVMPPLITDMLYNADMLVAEMDYAQVDWSLLHRCPYLGISNDYIADCCRQHPDRLQGLAYVREWLIAKDPEAAAKEVHRSITELGLHGLHVLPHFASVYGVTDDWDSGPYRQFWDEVAKLGIPLFFTLIAHERKTVEGYLEQLRILTRWVERYPDVQVVLTHGFDWMRFLDGKKLSIPKEVYEAAPCDHPNFFVQFLPAVFLGKVYDYPMLEMKPTLEDMVRYMGIDRLLWGTDIPILMRYTTYLQSLDQIRLHCEDIFGVEGLDRVMGENMGGLMGLT